MVSYKPVRVRPVGARPGTAARPRAGGRRGAAVVEMAVVAPLFFLLILGSVEFGRAMMTANVITSSAREGARVGVLPNNSNTEVTAAVQKELSSANINPARATITVLVNGTQANASTANTGDAVTVTVKVPFSDVSWLPTPMFLTGGTNVQGQAVMRRE